MTAIQASDGQAIRQELQPAIQQVIQDIRSGLEQAVQEHFSKLVLASLAWKLNLLSILIWKSGLLSPDIHQVMVPGLIWFCVRPGTTPFIS